MTIAQRWKAWRGFKGSMYLGILLWGGLYADASVAQEKWYAVEIIVFENTPPLHDGREHWLEVEDLEPINDGIALQPNAEFSESAARAFSLLPVAAHQLTRDAEQIANAPQHRLVTHAAWQQPAIIGQPAEYVRLPSDNPNLLGTTRLRLGRYLHADVDIRYENPATGRTIRMAESQKIRLNDLHYFDHPLFGILMRVSRAGQASNQ